MSIFNLDSVSLSYGPQVLLDHVDFQIEPGERVCLVGRNGAGKSTMLKVIEGGIVPDDGEVWRRAELKISYLTQDVPENIDDTVFDVVAAGLGEQGQLIMDYHHAVARLGESQDDTLMAQLADLQHKLEAGDGWNVNLKVETVLSKLDLPADARLNDLSGGLKRRVLLARALVSEPDLLLLDEPTNHLDIKAINWLEEFLLAYRGALIFITHDRTFLRKLATRIIELDRGILRSYPGDYETYLRKKEEELEAEEKQNARFDKKLAQEEAWIRQGIKARRTRNEGRVRALKSLRKEREQRRERQGSVSMGVDTGDLSGKLVADLRHIEFGYGEKPIIRDFSTRIMRGDRVGLIGANGSGKSTLLKIILGQLKPQKGDVVLGTRLQVAYFDQQREQLELEKSVRDNISDGKERIDINGRSRHVISYLKDFLFPPDKIDTPVKALSGGERNRLLLARIFTRPCNLLVLDEPTNDLDVDTLELLEDLLSDYDGTLLLVSHDRTFLDNVVTSTIVFEEDGRIEEYVGGYEDWLRQRKTPVVKKNAQAQKNTTRAQETTQKPEKNAAQKRKLSYKEQRELEGLPALIEQLEEEQSNLQSLVSSPGFYQQEKDEIASSLARLEEVGKQLEEAYSRWEILDGITA